MHSGGDKTLEWEVIYIEGSVAQAVEIFEQKFGRSPYSISCECCGEDYSVDDDSDLEQASGYERNCKYDDEAEKYVADPSNEKYLTIEQYKQRDDVLIIPKEKSRVYSQKAELKHDSIIPDDF